MPLRVLAEGIKTRLFADTSSTRLELQTLLWALSERVPGTGSITVLTDSQNIVSLPSRRGRIEASGFCSKQGRPLSNADLYRTFFALLDQRAFQLVKVKGHSRASEKTAVERVFSLVDQAARRGCRGAVGDSSSGQLRP